MEEKPVFPIETRSKRGEVIAMYATMRNIRLYGTYGGHAHDFMFYKKKEK